MRITTLAIGIFLACFWSSSLTSCKKTALKYTEEQHNCVTIDDTLAVNSTAQLCTDEPTEQQQERCNDNVTEVLPAARKPKGSFEKQVADLLTAVQKENFDEIAARCSQNGLQAWLELDLTQLESYKILSTDAQPTIGNAEVILNNDDISMQMFFHKQGSIWRFVGFNTWSDNLSAVD